MKEGNIFLICIAPVASFKGAKRRQHNDNQLTDEGSLNIKSKYKIINKLEMCINKINVITMMNVYINHYEI